MSARWQDKALCREVGAEIFFPEDDNPSAHAHRYADARSVCMACPVRVPCLDAAMAIEGTCATQDRGGMWGGLSPRERTAHAKAHTRQGAAA